MSDCPLVCSSVRLSSRLVFKLKGWNFSKYLVSIADSIYAVTKRVVQPYPIATIFFLFKPHIVLVHIIKFGPNIFGYK